MLRLRVVMSALLATSVLVPAQQAMAQVVPTDVPGAADPSRIRPQERAPQAPLDNKAARVKTDSVLPAIEIPKGSESVRFVLQSLKLEGVSAFEQKDFTELYQPLLGKEVSLKQIYELAARITLMYRDEGYLLSYAYVPDQSISDGAVRIAVAEGYVARVVIEGEDPNARISKHYIEQITSQRPLQQRTMESALLRLSDLPGYSYRAVLGKEKNAAPNETMLTLVPMKKKAQANISFDNFSSRYLGPNEVSATYSDSFLPLQQTTLMGLTSLPTDRLNYALINHFYVLIPDVTLEGSGSYTKSEPAYRLSALDIKGDTKNFKLGVNYQWLRQRNENLLVKFAAEYRDVNSDIAAATPLTRDDIRSVHVNASYDVSDQWDGTNIINATITQGIDGLGSSKKGDTNLSRSQARPDFTKLEISLSRMQRLSDSWAAQFQVAGQESSGPLYASEEFGVGGQSYGRAYDSSEIVGDRGISGAIELRYTALRTMQPINFEPFLYLDSGIVENDDVGQSKRDSLSSFGGGVRFASTHGQSGLLGFAIPLARDVGAPVYGANPGSPRVMLQLAQSF